MGVENGPQNTDKNKYRSIELGLISTLKIPNFTWNNFSEYSHTWEVEHQQCRFKQKIQGEQKLCGHSFEMERSTLAGSTFQV